MATTAAAPPTPKDSKKKEIYTYEAPWMVYGMNWSVRPDHPFRLAIGSFMEEYNNKIEIIQLDDESEQFKVTATQDHPYPSTKIMFAPTKVATTDDIFATTGDYLRLWKIGNDGVNLKSLLNNNKSSEFCAPLTSFDWNEADPSIIGTSSIDTTCTIWNVETHQAKTQLIAHDKEVYDIAFAPSTDVFASVGADGSVRMFDLRSLEHSTIIYESPDLVPLLRLAWNKQDHNYMATFMMDDNKVVILDIRSCHICSVGDDQQALIWDLSAMPKPIDDPILAYGAESSINTLQWSSSQPDWVAISFDKTLQILRV